MQIRIVLLIILTTSIQLLSATPIASQTIDKAEIRLELKNETLVQAFQKIESQSPFHFMYRNEDVKDIVNLRIPASKQTIEAFLKTLLANTSLIYRQVDMRIMITSTVRPKGGSNTGADKGANEFLALADGVISGKISDTTGVTMSGVSIQLAGTATQTKTTDANGNYSFTNLPAGKYTLSFSFVGFTKTSKEVTLAEGQKSVINLVLNEVPNLLQDVVVVGYGTEKRVNVIGSVSQVSGEKLENRAVTSLSNALAGQMSGVTVIQRSGKPGESGGHIRIRGIGSFGADPDPLVLVDGIPGSLNEININDIESISVLKDAASAAIYGARSANGVILVTTKKGIQGKARVNYTGYVGIQKPTEFPDLVNSWEYAELFNIASGTNTFTPDVIAKYKAMNDLDNYPNTNFLKETYSRNGVQHGHDISIAGGQKSNQYYLSLGYLNQQGAVEKNDYKRYNFRMNVVNELSSKFTITTRMSGSIEKRNEPQPTATKNAQTLEEIVDEAVRFPATFLGQASNGDFGIGPAGKGTPVSWLASASYLRRPVTKAGVNTKLDWKPVKGLILSVIGGYNYSVNEVRSYNASQVLNPTTSFTTSLLQQSRNQDIFQTLQSLAEYSKELKRNNFKILAGYSFESQASSSFSGTRQDFPSNDYTVLNIGGVDNQQVNGNDSKWAIQSIFGRLNYNYNSKYLFEATVRRDGSSRFPPKRKYATFPSLAAGWRISREEFFKAAFPWVSNLKLKASWGILGNQNIGTYPYQSTLSPGSNYPFGTGITSGAAYTSYKDQNIHWESTRSADVGLESEFLAGKANFNLTYFNRNTYDILYQPSNSVSSILGVSIGAINTGEVRNSGWEVELGHRNNFGDLYYQIQGIFTLINNEVVTLGLGNVTQPNRLVGNGSNLFIGYPLELYYGYKTDGVFLDANDIKSWANQTKITPNAVAGDIRYRDISGPNGIPDGFVDPTYDRTYIGSSLPKYTFSLNLGTQFKGLDFTAFLQGVANVKGRLERYSGHAFWNTGNVQRWQMEGRFDPQNPQRYPEYPRLQLLANGEDRNPNTAVSDWWVIDASYLRIKNLQIGYTLPQSKFRSSLISKMRFYLSAENFYTFKKYRKGWDPEIKTNSRYYPILANYVVGINASF